MIRKSYAAKKLKFGKSSGFDDNYNDMVLAPAWPKPHEPQDRAKNSLNYKTANLWHGLLGEIHKVRTP